MTAPVDLLSASRERAFREWYSSVAAKLGINPDPDDPEHYYDYRSFFDAISRGEAVSPDQPGGHFPSQFKRPGHPRMRLKDSGGKLFDTKDGAYLDGTSPSKKELSYLNEAPDQPVLSRLSREQLLSLPVFTRGIK